MKLIASLALFSGALMSQSAWADAGPYFVSYPGFCNVKRVYIDASTNVYGTEIGCSSSIGAPLVGAFGADGTVIVSVVSNGAPCINTYYPNGGLLGGCSNGGPITYLPRGSYTVRQNSVLDAPKREFNVSTEMPDLEKTKNLPPRPE